MQETCAPKSTNSLRNLPQEASAPKSVNEDKRYLLSIEDTEGKRITNLNGPYAEAIRPFRRSMTWLFLIAMDP